MSDYAGVLYVVATPIGNLADLTPRARETLAAVDLIAAEDTRTTRTLLGHCAISATLVSYHDHNETARTAQLIAELEAGRKLALVADAGTPLISDPGYRLVAAARERGIRVVPIPGASAAICALSAAGLASDRFLFLGFPPRTPARQRAWLRDVCNEPGTLIVYENPKRAPDTLAAIAEVLGERQVVLARELTKRFETFLSGPPTELLARLSEDQEQRLGELVILIAGRPTQPSQTPNAEHERVLRVLAAELPLTQACTLAARLTGAKKNALYRLGLTLDISTKQHA